MDGAEGPPPKLSARLDSDGQKVLSLSLGIETLGGVFCPLVERNTPIPTRKSEVFSTAADNQTSVEIKVYEGERTMAGQNRLLGVFQLVGIPPAPRGLPQIEVTFEIDADGILNFSAKDRATGREQKVTITTVPGLCKEEVEKIARDAASYAREDQTLRERIEARNRADAISYNTERVLQEQRSKISEQQATRIEIAIKEAKDSMQSGTVEEINRAVESLTSASQPLAEAMHRSAAQDATGDTADQRDPQGYEDLLDRVEQFEKASEAMEAETPLETSLQNQVASPSDVLVIECQFCGQKNRLSSRQREQGVYRCGSCKVVLNTQPASLGANPDSPDPEVENAAGTQSPGGDENNAVGRWLERQTECEKQAALAALKRTMLSITFAVAAYLTLAFLVERYLVIFFCVCRHGMSVRLLSVKICLRGKRTPTSHPRDCIARSVLPPRGHSYFRRNILRCRMVGYWPADLGFSLDRKNR